VVAFVGLAATWWIILPAFIIAAIDTRKNGFFIQVRIGRRGRPFQVIKLRTMREMLSFTTCVTTSQDPRITRWGNFFRKTKIDELPQLINVLFGQMSFVGPRPDVPGYADRLQGNDRRILELYPGITGPATLKFRNEETLLAQVPDPQSYNDEIIFPEKVRLNLAYLEYWSFWKDIGYILVTIMPGLVRKAGIDRKLDLA